MGWKIAFISVAILTATLVFSVAVDPFIEAAQMYIHLGGVAVVLLAGSITCLTPKVVIGIEAWWGFENRTRIPTILMFTFLLVSVLTAHDGQDMLLYGSVATATLAFLVFSYLGIITEEEE